MNPSKENAAEAKDRLTLIRAGSGNAEEHHDFIREFLEAAERKLPHESSFPKTKRNLAKNVQDAAEKGFSGT